MIKPISHFIFYTVTSWILGSLGYLLLSLIMPGGYVFGAWYRMFVYHYQHPYQYILVVAIAYGLVATIWSRYYGYLEGKKRFSSICAVILISLLIASVPGGLLWALHDIQAGFVPPDHVLQRNLIWAATKGLTFGWVIIALSIPYNLLGGLVGYYLTHYGQRFLAEKCPLIKK